MKGPLDRDKIPNANIKIHLMATKLKPTGKVRSIVDCSGPRTEYEGTSGFIYNPDFSGSLNSTIKKVGVPGESNVPRRVRQPAVGPWSRG